MTITDSLKIPIVVLKVGELRQTTLGNYKSIN
jgi:hypothetical protein